MHPKPIYIYINIHTLATTRSQHISSHITSNPILKHAYFLINSTYNTLTTRTLTLDILGHHKPTPLFHYTNSHHLSFEEHLHYLVLKFQELSNSDHNFTSSFFPTFQLKHTTKPKENTPYERAKKG